MKCSASRVWKIQLEVLTIVPIDVPSSDSRNPCNILITLNLWLYRGVT